MTSGAGGGVFSARQEERTVPDEQIADDRPGPGGRARCRPTPSATPATALELGAEAAQVIPAATVVVDDRVALKCAVPKCFGYGTCANCPPHAPSPEQMRSHRGPVRHGGRAPAGRAARGHRARPRHHRRAGGGLQERVLDRQRAGERGLLRRALPLGRLRAPGAARAPSATTWSAPSWRGRSAGTI